MGKTRDLFKKIRDTKGTFHVTPSPSLPQLSFRAEGWGLCRSPATVCCTDSGYGQEDWDTYV